MENNLIELSHSYFDEESHMQLASQEKLNVEKVKKGMHTIVPALYLGFLRKSGADLRQLLDRLRTNFVKIDTSKGLRFPELLDREADEEDDEKSRSILTLWFDEAYEETLKNTRNYLELDTSAALRLFSSAIPAVVASITGNGEYWDTTVIQANLVNNRAAFLKEIPSDLPLPKLSEGEKNSVEKEAASSLESDISKEAQHVDPVRDVVFADPIIPHAESENPPSAPEEDEGGYGRGAGWWWIVALIVLALLWFFFGRGCSQSERPMSDTQRLDSLITDSVVDQQTAETSWSDTATGEPIQLPIKNGEIITAFSGGLEENLIQFLDSSYETLSEEELSRRWFDCEQVGFKEGTANILPESGRQIDNLASILTAYPEVKVKIGGGTDENAEETENKRISTDRTVAVQQALSERGLAEQVAATEGYGSASITNDPDAPAINQTENSWIAVSIRR